jgi:hypothetical protein
MRTVLALCLCFSLAGVGRAQNPAPAPAAPAAATESEEVELPNPPKVWALSFGGAALGLWALAAATGGAALALSHAQEGDPTMPQPYTQDLADQASAGKSLAIASYVFIGLASVTTIVDAVLWYECLRKPRTMKDLTTPKKTARVRFTGAGVTF